MIRAVNLTQHYSVQPVLQNVDIEIPTGQLVAIVGPNGMGKSTLLSALGGVLSPQEVHRLASKTREAVRAGDGKAACHSDLVDDEAARKIQAEKLGDPVT